MRNSATRHYTRPRPAKLSATLDRPEVAGRHRSIDCRHYDQCLNWAVGQDWPSWSCRRCPYFDGGSMGPLITNSARKEFQACKRRYRYKYVDCIRPKGSVALQVGTICHVGFEAFWRGKPIKDAMKLMAMQMRLDDWWSTEKGRVEAARCRALMRGYYSRWQSSAIAWELVSAEETLIWDVGPYRIGSKLDVLARNLMSGEIFLVEHKTTSEEIGTVGDDYWLRLALDSQITIYQLLASEKLDEKVEILYDVAKKLPGNPKYKRRVVRRKNESDEALEERKTAALETMEEFEARLTAEAIDDESLYVRHQVHRTREQAGAIIGEWNEVAMEIVNYDGLYPRNDGACNSRFGKCPYLGVCSGHEALDDPKFTALTTPHPELDLEEYDGIDDNDCPL